MRFIALLIAPLLLLLPLGFVPPEREPGEGPEPSPTSIAWELNFTFNDPRRIEVAFANGRTEVYWYMLYTVVNTSDRTQRFHPQFEIVTEDLRVIDTDMGISPVVFDQIRALHARTHPHLLHPTRAIGELPAGEDNARDSVAIWRPFELTTNNFTLYVSGLSGETRLVKNPRHTPARKPAADASTPAESAGAAEAGAAGDAPEASGGAEKGAEGAAGGEKRTETAAKTAAGGGAGPKFFTLRKTLEIEYTLPGSPAARPLVQPERGRSRWVMR